MSGERAWAIECELRDDEVGLCNNEIYYWSSFYGGQGASARPASGGRVISAKQSELFGGRPPPSFPEVLPKDPRGARRKGARGSAPLGRRSRLKPSGGGAPVP